jgi:hypothetical protein
MILVPLNIALKKAVDDFGMCIMKSPLLVNILTDYHVLDVHNPHAKRAGLQLFTTPK